MIAKPKSKPKKRKQLRRKPQPAQKSKLNTKLTKIGVKKPERSSIKVEFHPVPKPGTRNGIRQVSNKQRDRERLLQKLKHFLVVKRAHGKCEICGTSRNLEVAHIIERSECGKDNAGNILIACGGIGGCHDHQKYTHGLPIEPIEVLQMVYQKNRSCGISKFMTGADVPREEEYE